MVFTDEEAVKLKGQFDRDGLLILKDFYNFDEEIMPIQIDIMKIVSIVCRRESIAVKIDTPYDAMNVGYSKLIAKDRSLGGVVYDAVKQIPSFLRLVGKEENQDEMKL